METPVICHVISMKHINLMNDNSRAVFYKSYGKHIFCNIDSDPPKADIYFLDCFIKNFDKFKSFKRPYPRSKIISLIHSSSVCMPSIFSDEIVVLTDAWKTKLLKKGFDSVVINNSIDSSLYKYDIDYKNKNFGRITRFSNKKVHPKFDKIVIHVLNDVPKSKCIMFCRDYENKPDHPRFIVDDTIEIHQHEKKAKKLSQLSILADMHNTFVEVFPMGLLESMASGHCCLLFSQVKQPSMAEVIGDAGIWCRTVKGFKNKLTELLNDVDQKKEYGLKAKERAKFYTCLLYTSPSPRDLSTSRMPSSA